MIIINTHRHYAKAVSENIFPFINLLKQSHYNNVRNQSRVSNDFLTVKLVNSLLGDVELILRKKLINTIGRTVKIKLNDAQAIALYKTLLIIPLDDSKQWLNMIRNEWLTDLDKQIFSVDSLAS